MIARALIVLVALLHLYFLVLEMFLWTAPRTRAAFGLSAEAAEQSKVLAACQRKNGHGRCDRTLSSNNS